MRCSATSYTRGRHRQRGCWHPSRRKRRDRGPQLDREMVRHRLTCSGGRRRRTSTRLVIGLGKVISRATPRLGQSRQDAAPAGRLHQLGKSSFCQLDACLCSPAPPEDVRMILIDPKMVEFHPVRDSAPDHPDHHRTQEAAAAALAWLVEEMEQRYQDMKPPCVTSTTSTGRCGRGDHRATGGPNATTSRIRTSSRSSTSSPT